MPGVRATRVMRIAARKTAASRGVEGGRGTTADTVPQVGSDAAGPSKPPQGASMPPPPPRSNNTAAQRLRLQTELQTNTEALLKLAHAWTDLYKDRGSTPEQDQRLREIFEDRMVLRARQQAELFLLNPEWVPRQPEIDHSLAEFHDFLLSHGDVDPRDTPFPDDLQDFIRRYDPNARQHTVGGNIPRSLYKASRSPSAQQVEHVAAKIRIKPKKQARKKKVKKLYTSKTPADQTSTSQAAAIIAGIQKKHASWKAVNLPNAQ